MRASAHPPVALGVAVALAVAAGGMLGARSASAEREPWAPGPWRAGAGASLLRDEDCAGCHADIAAEWRSSLHAQSSTDDYVARAIAAEPTAFCRGCHAPELDPDAPPRASLNGVGCVVCHVDESTVVGVKGRAAEGPHGHAVEARSVLAGNGACERCHAFAFPGQTSAMQRTHAEHAGSAYAGSTCASCHARRTGEGAAQHTDHRFAVQSDPEMMRRAIRATTATRSGDALAVTLEAIGVGHAYPTGDLNRSLELRAEIIDADGRVVAAASGVRLGRSFEERDGTRVEVADTRVPASGSADPERRVSVALPRAPRGAERVRWVLVWQRMNADVAAALGMDLEKNEIELLSGVVD